MKTKIEIWEEPEPTIAVMLSDIPRAFRGYKVRIYREYKKVTK